ncbi:MAG: penicillin-insensitive murein endopeptidase [Elusimicrobia bacterium]|nr:penicillin-insensitive murein endopeptidase [Elusimicrobiota bacterium]MDE2236759.1 penicillin-insensitive murein endopeptidase [Elusimicrobiota bacterium]MDE2426439.1 penicillin-insensitive murein endopeptidase [Elusimicrobiota bacterium]
MVKLTLATLLLACGAWASEAPRAARQRTALARRQRTALGVRMEHDALLARDDGRWKDAAYQDNMPSFADDLRLLRGELQDGRVPLPKIEEDLATWENSLCGFLYARRAASQPADRKAFCAMMRGGISGLVAQTRAWRGRRVKPRIDERARQRLEDLRRVVGAETADYLFDKSRNLKDAVGSVLRLAPPARPRPAILPPLPTLRLVAVPAPDDSPLLADHRLSWVASYCQYARAMGADLNSGAQQLVGYFVNTVARAVGSTGVPWGGRLVDGVALPWKGTGYQCIGYGHWGTETLVKSIETVAGDLKRFGAPTLLVGDLSARYGGRFGGHLSHQNGHDVDLCFIADKDGHFDVADNLYLIESVLAHMHATNIFVGTRFKALLMRRAKILLEQGKMSRKVYERANSVLQYWPGHNDHFHVRIA